METPPRYPKEQMISKFWKKLVMILNDVALQLLS
jgi:hypothetical protein